MFRSQNFRGLRVALIVTWLSSVQAEAGSYSFGGGCASVGAWSQLALSQTAAIMKIVESLKDNPDCKGLETVIPKLQLAQDLLKTPEGELKRTDRLESIPSEINALRNFAVASPDLKSQVLKLLTSRTIEGASLAAEATKVGTAIAPEAAAAMAVAQGIQDIQVRLRRASLTGLDMLDQVFAVLPSYDRCLIGRPDQGMALISAAVKLTASFASSNDGVLNRMSHTISGLVNLMRNRKFSNVLRKLDESEFWLSMSCLLESTTATYCNARDAQRLLQYGIREMQATPDKKTGEVKVANPLEGYYVLTRDIPRISEWLQKIQFGIVPKLSTDAAFKNRVWGDVTALMQEINSIRGVFSESLLTYSTLTDVESKRNALMKLIRVLTSRLTGPGGDAEHAGRVNFFTMTVIEELIPFRLIGLDQIPPECASNKEGKFVIPWDQWMINGGKFQPPFGDPDALARGIGAQLETLIDAALTKASLYFQQRMIVDMSNLVNESVTSQTITVVQSLQRVYAYLQVLEKRIIEADDDLILIPSIRNTRARIKKVLDSYQAVRDIIKKEPLNDDEELKSEEIVKAAYKKVIEMAYEHFNILLQRDTFLSTRLGTFIHYDYAMRIKRSEDMTPWEQDLLMATGKDLLNRLLSVTGQNPTAVQLDLSTAQVVNKRNLEALEALLRDSLYPSLVELGHIASGKPPSNLQLAKDSLYRMYKDSYFKHVKPENTSVQNGWAYAWAFGKIGITGGLHPFVRRLWHADLYPFYITPYPTFRGADDEFGSFDQFRAKLCVQTLAFEDRKFFEPVCRGTTLKSAFDVTNDSTVAAKIKLNLPYETYMSTELRSRPVTGNSICAFQTYTRRNLVYWMNLDLENQKKER